MNGCYLYASSGAAITSFDVLQPAILSGITPN